MSTATNYPSSTLLIPESVVWLPYVGVVMMVISWLGYDFIRFHQKNKAKYARMRDFLSVQTAAPVRHNRISMTSSVGVKFKNGPIIDYSDFGKPVLGDVWNTSPSSSDLSSYSPVRDSKGAWSRAISSDEDGDNQDNDTAKRLDTVVGLLRDKSSDNDVQDGLPKSLEEPSQTSLGFAPGDEEQCSTISKLSYNDNAAVVTSQVAATVHHDPEKVEETSTPRMANSSTQTPALPAEIHDALSKLIEDEFFMDSSDPVLSSRQVLLVGPREPDSRSSSPQNHHRRHHHHHRRSHHQVLALTDAPIIDFSSPRSSNSRHYHHSNYNNQYKYSLPPPSYDDFEDNIPTTPSDYSASLSLHPPYTSRHSRSPTSRHRHESLKLDMAAARSPRPHSKRHSYSVDTLEPPQFPGSSGHPSVAHDVFKPPELHHRSSSPAFIKSSSTTASSSQVSGSSSQQYKHPGVVSPRSKRESLRRKEEGSRKERDDGSRRDKEEGSRKERDDSVTREEGQRREDSLKRRDSKRRDETLSSRTSREDTIPRREQIGSRRDEATDPRDESSQKRDDSSPRRDDTSPRRDDMFSRRDDASSRRDDASSRRDDTSPRREDPSQRIEELSQRIDDSPHRNSEPPPLRREDSLSRREEVPGPRRVDSLRRGESPGARREDSQRRHQSARTPRSSESGLISVVSGSSTARAAPSSSSTRQSSQSPRRTPPRTAPSTSSAAAASIITLSTPTPTQRSSSGSPRVPKEPDRTKKQRKETGKVPIVPDKPEEIPAHLYHEDEEGFFSSIVNLNPSRFFHSGNEDPGSKKGILFFSRLSGAGRRDPAPKPGQGGRRTSGGGGYRSGGFDDN